MTPSPPTSGSGDDQRPGRRPPDAADRREHHRQADVARDGRYPGNEAARAVANRAREPSTGPGDGALTRIEAVKNEHLRRWDVATPSATVIGRPERPGEDVDATLRQLHAEAHPAMAGHSGRMHRLEKARITHAFCNTLDVTPWERDRALGIMVDLDLTAFGSQRAVERVALVVVRHVVDEERERVLGLHDEAWLADKRPDELSSLYERFDSLTDDPAYQRLLDAHDLDTTAVNRLRRTLREQLDEQDLHGAVLGRSPHRDPALPAIRDDPPAVGETDEADGEASG